MDKLNLLKNFDKIFQSKIIDDEEIPAEQRKVYLNPERTIAIMPKVKGYKKILLENFYVTEDVAYNLNYNLQIVQDLKVDNMAVFARVAGEKSEITENEVKISKEYLKTILAICSRTKDETIIMKFRKNYPLWIETKEMIAIIAPRIENE
jgi:hypothetical protein